MWCEPRTPYQFETQRGSRCRVDATARACVFQLQGKLVLNSSALTFVTTLSQPKKVKDPIDPLNRSLWSLRRCLTAAGWTQGVSGKHASIKEKCFNSKSEHHAYFAILLQRTRADDYLYAFCFLHNLDCKRCGAMFFFGYL